MRYAVGGTAVVVAVLVGSVATGCSVSTSGTASPAEAPTAQVGIGPAAATVPVSGPVAEAGSDLGRACPLPLSFTLAEGWTAQSVDLDAVEEAAGEGGEILAELFRRGPFAIACEADAGATGDIGFLRVFTAPGPGDGPQAALESFLAGENPRGQAAGTHQVNDVSFTDFQLDGHPAAEVTYESYSTTLERNDPGVAFAVDTPDGVVVVELDGLDAQELRPAYELAKQTVRVG